MKFYLFNQNFELGENVISCLPLQIATIRSVNFLAKIFNLRPTFGVSFTQFPRDCCFKKKFFSYILALRGNFGVSCKYLSGCFVGVSCKYLSGCFVGLFCSYLQEYFGEEMFVVMLCFNILQIFVRVFCRVICRNVAFRGKILCYPGQLFVHIRSSANKHVCQEQEKALSIINKTYQSSTNTCLKTTLSTINSQKQMHAVQ